MSRALRLTLVLAVVAAPMAAWAETIDEHVGAGFGPMVQIAPLPRTYPVDAGGLRSAEVDTVRWAVGGRLYLFSSPGVRVGGEGAGGTGPGWVIGYGGFSAEVLEPLGPFDGLAGAGVGFGGLGLRPQGGDLSVKFLYLQPRAGLLLPMGPVSAELHVFLMVPVVLAETLEEQPVTSGSFYGFAGIGFAVHLESGSHRRH
jgi:hypothetical protein